MFNRDNDNLNDIIESIDKIIHFINGFSNADDLHKNTLHFDAILMNFISIGESVSRLSDSIISSYPEIEWVKIRGLRNIIAHDYFGVDAEEIWQISHNNLPDLKNRIKKILS